MDLQQHVYEKMYDSDLEEHAGSDDSLLQHGPHHRPAVRKSHRYMSLISHAISVFVGIVICYIAIGSIDMHSHQTCSDTQLRRSSVVPEELTQYSETVRYNGSLEFPSMYRGTWEEVDAAWDAIINVGFLDLEATEADIEELGVDRETLAQFPAKDGGGYVMTIEYTHQIHCLDLLRRVNPWNLPEYRKLQAELEESGKEEHNEELFRIHVDHCTEMLRQVLMCHADTTPIFEQWVSVRGHPWPNFNTVHQCRNFDAIHKWTQAHAKPADTEWPMRPKGTKALPLPP